MNIYIANAETVFFGPTSYLSTDNIPNGFYEGEAPIILEDFEDNSLDFGLIPSAGVIIDQNDRHPNNDVDSVDADDGFIDGSGSLGHSWFQNEASAGVTFTFPSLVTAAGLVWTDSLTATPVVFEAFGPGMVSLGATSPAILGDSVFTGTTAEDRFFGVQDLNGILAIRITVLTNPGTSGLEVDHVQFGNAPGDTTMCAGQIATVIGTNEDDLLMGTEDNDIIAGLSGNDIIYGRGGNDIICGNDRHDTILGGDGNDTLYGGNDGDHLTGGKTA